MLFITDKESIFKMYYPECLINKKSAKWCLHRPTVQGDVFLCATSCTELKDGIQFTIT